MGLAGYYRRFVKDFGKIAQPLTNCLKARGGFHWNRDADIAFERLKRALVTAPVLVLPDFLVDFVIEMMPQEWV